MLLRTLKLRNFKLHQSLDLEFDSRICVITGRNGCGKTNLLDAIHHAGLLRSAFHREDARNIRFGESFYRIDALLEENGKSLRLALLCESEKKKRVEWNGKALERMNLHLGQFPLVLVLPDEPFQMNESADWRRSAIDNVFSQAVPEYAEQLSRFKKFLNQRNALLGYFASGRRYDPLLLDALDEELAEASMLVWNLRQLYLPVLIEGLNREYQQISAGRESAGMLYQSQLTDFPASDLLRSRRHTDLEAGRTTAGLHRDDFEYQLDGYSLRKFASQGQQKSFLLALKFAQLDFIAEKLGKAPCLLLDDVFDKLDEERIACLLKRLWAPGMGQVFITDAREERSRALLRDVQFQMLSLEGLSG